MNMCCRMKRRSHYNIAEDQIMDENFDCLLRVAQAMCSSLARPKDRFICGSTLDSLAQFNRTSSIEAKRYVRRFLRFYMRVLRWTQTHQPLQLYAKWYNDGYPLGQPKEMTFQQNEMHHWLDPERSFLAMKHFENGDTIIYSAVAKNPTSGWITGGLKSLTTQTQNM